MVDAVIAGEDELRNRCKGIPILYERLDNSRQRLGRMECGVVEEDDGTGLHPFQNPLGDFRRR